MKTSFYGVFLSFCPPFNSCNMTRSSQYLTSPHILSQRAGPNSLFIFIRMFRIILTENYPNQITIINIAITLMIANVCPPSTRYLWTMIWLRTQVQLMGVKQVTHYPVGIVQSHLTLPNQKQYISIMIQFKLASQFESVTMNRVRSEVVAPEKGKSHCLISARMEICKHTM